jgi:hypothetical protein
MHALRAVILQTAPKLILGAVGTRTAALLDVQQDGAETGYARNMKTSLIAQWIAEGPGAAHLIFSMQTHITPDAIHHIALTGAMLMARGVQ